MTAAGRTPAALAVTAAAILALACVSERADVTGLPGNLDCSIPVDSLTSGNVGVVVMKDLAFHPSELRVRAGTRVIWINCESKPAGPAHTTTADNGAWSSGLLSSGEVYSVVFDQVGALQYHCDPHPFMRASVIVE